MSQRQNRRNVAGSSARHVAQQRWPIVGAAVAALGLAGSAMGQNVSWVGPAGVPAPFEVGSNWSTGSVPGGTDLASISNGGIASLTTFSGSMLTLSLGAGPGTSGAVIQSGGSLTADAGYFIAGDLTSTGTYTLNSGELRGNDFYVGEKGVGTLNVNGGTITSTANMRLGESEGSNGVMNMTGGVVSMPGFFLVGHFSPAGSPVVTTGTFNMSGGTLTAANYNLGQHPNARGEVHQSGGFINNSANLVVGEISRQENLYDLSGGTLRIVNNNSNGSAFIGSSAGIGTLRVRDNGNAQIDGHIFVAGGTTAFGTFSMSGGTVALGLNKPEGGFLVVGEFGQGTSTISGGNFNSDFIQLGRRATAESRGQLTQTGGDVTVRRSITIGGLSGNENFYAISGGALNLPNVLGGGTNTFDETQSGIHVARFSVDPEGPTPVTAYSKARFTVSGTAAVNIAGGLFNSTGFTPTTGPNAGVPLPGGAGTVQVTGGSLTAGSFLNGGEANAGSFNNGGATANYVQSGGTASLGAVTGTGQVNVSGGAMNVASMQQFAVTVSGGTVRVAPNGTAAATSRVNTIATSGSGRFDLTNNALVVATTPLADVRSQIVSAFAGGAWNGPGITSSNGNNTTHGLGYAQASALSAVPAIFGAVTGDPVLVRATRYGDADLSGTVNLQDFNRLAANFGASGAVWSQGDFDYNGSVNLQDFNRLAANFGQSAAGASVTPQDWANLASAIPEPSSLALLGLGAVAAVRRRRRTTEK